MEKVNFLTCGFHLVRNGEFKRCGEKATHHFHGKCLCPECAKYMKMRGLPVFKMQKSTVEKKLKDLNKAEQKEAVAV
ncbi:MAG: hypothetical protein PQJ58_15090 [Spirochaetales bacterium]|nr:hypothetical protein [Spirochaetales bacterium]